MVHGKHGWDVTLSAFKVSSMLMQLDLQSLSGLSVANTGVGVSREGWEVFCDGSWCWQGRSGGWAVALSWNGVLVECRTGFTKTGMVGLQTEVNAINIGMQLADEHRCQTCKIYSDCVNAIRGLQSWVGHLGLSSLVSIIITGP